MGRPERYRLALFPLPTVLFPGTATALHIFEPRYRDLVRDCLQAEGRFGLIYHDWDRQGPFLSEEGRIGSVTEIREHQGLPDGRSLIAVAGVGRFRIVDGIESDARYFEALVTPYRDALPSGAAGGPAEHAALLRRRGETLALFRRVVESLSEHPLRLPELSSEVEVAFRVAQTLAVDPAWHQRLLELRTEAARLGLLDEILRSMLEPG